MAYKGDIFSSKEKKSVNSKIEKLRNIAKNSSDYQEKITKNVSEYKDTIQEAAMGALAGKIGSFTKKPKKKDTPKLFILLGVLIVILFLAALLGGNGSKKNSKPTQTTKNNKVEPATKEIEKPTKAKVEEKETKTSEKEEPKIVSYSTNTEDTVKNGNSGVYAYKKSGSYDLYYIVDFDEGYVYSFLEGNGEESCDRLKIESGNLNDVLILTYHEGVDEWSYGLHFKYKNHPEHLIFEDNDHFEYDYYTTNLKDALKLRDKKKIHNY